MKRWMTVSLVFVFGLTTLGASGYWAYARQHLDERGHMNNQKHHGSMMNGNNQKGMPKIHSNMSDDQMSQYCDRMEKHHESMMESRRKSKKRLKSLLQSMQQASSDEKVSAMEDVLVELVNQHNKHGTMMMKSRHAMMGSMMGMHRMDEGQRQQMMKRMRNCPMMKNMMNRNHQRGTSMHSPEDGN